METCKFEVSYEPSNYLRSIEFQSAEQHLKANANLPVRFVALCNSPISFITDLIGAMHEFVVVSVGHNAAFNSTRPGYFGNPVEFNKVDFVIFEFSKKVEADHSSKAAVINLTSFSIHKQHQNSIDWALESTTFFSKMTKMKSCDNPAQVSLSDVLRMSGALASAGYDIVENNCRHFARSLYSSVKHGAARKKNDNGQYLTRHLAKALALNGSAASVPSAAITSFAAQQVTKLAFLVCLDGGGTSISIIASQLATDPEAWRVFIGIIQNEGYVRRIRDYI
jgi:hypothetical protein